jgi:ABC-2 type transport system permease protein
MPKLVAGIITEYQKVCYKRKTIVLLVLSALITLVAAQGASSLQNRVGVTALGASDFPIWVLGLFTNYLLPLFIFMIAAESFAGEIADGTMKLVLLRPVTRFKVYIAKIAAIGLFILSELAVVLVASLAGNFFLGGGGAGLSGGLFRGIIAYSVALIPMLGLGILASFISLWMRSSSGALTVSILVYIACRLLPVAWPQVSRLLLVTYTDWHLLWLGASAGPGKIIMALLFILSNMIIFLAAGFYLFDKKEL